MTSVSATEAVRHFGEYLARIKHRGERFVLTKNDQPVAELTPVSVARTGTWGDLCDALARLPVDPSFADDLAKVNASDRPAANPWA